MLTQAELKATFTYNPITGIFTSIKGKEYSSKPTPSRRYARLTILGRPYMQHRLAWLYTYGSLPKCIDHIDGDRSNNKLQNLRECTQGQNNANSRARKGLKGAYKARKSAKWNAVISVRGVSKYLGSFNTELEAHAAYCAEAKYQYGEFFRAN